MAKSPNGLSEDTKTIITILLLVFVYPAGVIMMFVWMKSWPTWVKTLVFLPLLAVIFMLTIMLMSLPGLIGRYKYNQRLNKPVELTTPAPLNSNQLYKK